MEYTYEPQGICPMQIKVSLEGDIVQNVEFIGGCPGNLTAISRVVKGMPVAKVEELFSGIQCGRKPTSCSDQLVKACKAALAAG